MTPLSQQFFDEMIYLLEKVQLVLFQNSKHYETLNQIQSFLAATDLFFIAFSSSTDLKDTVS